MAGFTGIIYTNLMLQKVNWKPALNEKNRRKNIAHTFSYTLDGS
jgi:hypothetical protein